MEDKYYAHSIENETPDKWQSLEEHLNNVGELAGLLAGTFNSSFWAKITGENHDIGKGLREWLAWLRRVNDVKNGFSEFYTGHVNHAIHGAKRVYDLYREKISPHAKVIKK
jgi:hypothetical protein